MKAQEKLLNTYNVRARVVSMPGWDLFEAQDQAYRDGILPPDMKKRVTVEAASTYGWDRWATDEGIIIGIDHYGASAPGDEILKHFGFTAEHVTSAALQLLGRYEDAKREYGGDTTGFAATAPHEGHS
jgi:transketolase